MVTRFHTVAITGASSGLGAALALSYADPGRMLAISARRSSLLAGVRRACEGKGAAVLAAVVDVRLAAAVEGWIAAIEERHPIDLLVANAGVFTGFAEGSWREAASAVAETVTTNLLGTINVVNSVLPAMVARGHGHIAVISSLAALQPAADAPTYSATKAALLAYGGALRERLAGTGVTISVVLPGHIETAQTDVHHGPLPGIVTAAEAAATIKSELDRGRTFIAFPRTIVRDIRATRLLPWKLRARLNRPYRFHVGDPKKKPGKDPA